MPNQNLPLVHPKVLVLVFVSSCVRDVVSFVPVLTEALLMEAKLRATNFALQYGAVAVTLAAERSVIDPLAPMKLFEAASESLANVNSPQEAAAKGIIAFSSCVLCGAASEDAATSFAFAGFFAVFCQHVLGYQIILPFRVSKAYIVIYAVKKIIIVISNEIQIEILRHKYNLPRKLPKITLSKLNPFRKNKKAQEFFIYLPRVKKREFTIRSRKFRLYCPYRKKHVIKPVPMVKHIAIH